MNSDDVTPNIRQKISGNGHQIAARDIINEGGVFNPNPTNPKLMKCECGWAGLNVQADLCPQCGYNHLRDRIAEEERGLQKAREEQLRTRRWLATAFAVVFIGATQLSTRTSLGLLDAFLLTGASLFALWFAWIMLTVHYEEWRAKRKQRGTYGAYSKE